MSNKKSKKLYNYIENKTLKWYYFIPLLIIVAIIPLIFRGKYLELKGVQILFWKGVNYNVDVYSYWKAFWLVVMGILSTIIYLGLLIDKKLSFKLKNYFRYYIPLTIYILFVIISSFTSYYPEIVYGGFVELHQGMYVLITYSLLTFLMINYINNESDIKLFTKAFIFIIIVEGVLGVGQYFGADFLKSKLGIDLMIPNNLVIESSTHIFDKYTIYGTLYNTNFVGSFAAIIIPLSITFYINSKSKRMKIMSAIAMFLSACLWIGCNSRAGYIGLISAGIISAIFLRKQIIRNYKFVLSLLSGLLFIFVVFNTVSGGRILRQFLRLNLSEEIDKIEDISKSSENVIFKDIFLEQDQFTIVTNLQTLIVEFIDNRFKFLDENYKEIKTDLDEDNNIILKDEKYKYYKILTDIDSKSVFINAYKREIEFYFIESGAKILTSGNRLVEPSVASKLNPLNKYERFASNRGYIWSRSVMMLPKVILKGYGPDTFTVVFPQDDFIAKLNVGWSANMIVDKPHNMYLQTAINTGVISLLALLILWGIYLISSIKLYKSMIYDSIEKNVGFACFVAVFAYLIAGIFNDQIVSVAPLFWLVLGMGISINEKLIQKNKK